MKKMMLTMVALLSMTLMTAQTNKGNGPKKMSHEEITTQMTSQLKLDDAQKTKVAALNKEYQDYLMPQPPQKPSGNKQANGKPSRKGNGQQTDQQRPDNKQGGNSQNQAKRQEYEQKLKEILSSDQYKSYQQMRPQRKGKPKGMKRNQTTTEE